MRVSRPRRPRDDFGGWFDRTWWSKCAAAFNETILGRKNPEDLAFKTELFRGGTAPLCDHAITLVTQCSVDRIPQLEAQARAWNGAMSVAIFIQAPATDLPAIAELHERLTATGSSLSIEIILVHSLAADGEFSEYERLYPINTLRNTAVEHARTELLFLVDVDFVPCRRLCKLASTQLWAASVAQHAAAGELTVIPAFETTPDVKMPTEQQDMLAQLNTGTAEGFHVSQFPKGHAPTNFAKWATSSTRYEVKYEECYEPYVIGNRHLLPKYDERFRGYGMNKIQQLYACNARGLRFVVEPHVFVAAAEHKRSTSWKTMYSADGATALKNCEHPVRVAMIWGRFKEEISSGHPPGLMGRVDAPRVLERRRARVAAAFATTGTRQVAKEKAQARKVEAAANCVSRLSAVAV